MTMKRTVNLKLTKPLYGMKLKENAVRNIIVKFNHLFNWAFRKNNF